MFVSDCDVGWAVAVSCVSGDAPQPAIEAFILPTRVAGQRAALLPPTLGSAG